VARRKFTTWSCKLTAQTEGLTEGSVREGAVSLRADENSSLRDNRGYSTVQFSSESKTGM